MSLQPGPEDPKDESALTPPPEEASGDATREEVGGPDPAGAQTSGSTSAPQSDPGYGPAPSTPPPSAPQGAPPPPAWQPGPQGPPPPQGWQPAPQAPPPPPASGWGAPPQPADQSYAPPPSGGYGGPPVDYPPPGYPPQGYQAVGYGQPPQTDSKAIVGLILAISSWVVCPLITAVIALILAAQSNQAIDASGGRLEGRSLNTATKVIAWINIVLGIVAIVALIVLLAVGISIDTSGFDSSQF